MQTTPPCQTTVSLVASHAQSTISEPGWGSRGELGPASESCSSVSAPVVDEVCRCPTVASVGSSSDDEVLPGLEWRC